MLIITLLILVFLSSWFSGMEIAMFSLTPAKVKELVLAKKKNALLLERLLSKKHRLLVVILLGNNLINIVAASLAAVAAVEAFGSIGVGLATGIMTILILIFGEMYPKAYYQIHAAKVALRFSPLIYVLQIVLWPIVVLLEKLLNILTGNKKREKVSEKEFKALSRLAVEKGVLQFKEHEMIMNVLEFNDIKVKQIMVPKYKMELLQADAHIDQVAYFVGQTGFSRYPVYRNQKNNVIGYVHAISILQALNSEKREDPIFGLVKPILKVNEEDKINLVFNRMIKTHTHMALVFRKKEVVGLVTLEDLLEEIVGEIRDETDEPIS
ncbi:MAG: hemolysin family protein [Patescibacteria group bacterium]|nr:hemolysin family protein [Patescibacteria group bacterium]